MLNNLRATGFSLLLTFLTLAGCGGHHSGGSSASTDTIVFNNGKVAAVGDDAKVADEAKLSAQFGASWSADNSALARQLVATMQTMPEFREGGIAADGTAWGRYADGTYVGFATNDPDGPGTAPAAARAKPLALAKQGTSVVRPKDLPGAAVAYVYEAMESARSQATPTIVDELKAVGYRVVTGNGSLADWSAVSGAGILINHSHGGITDGNYYVTTTTAPTPLLNGLYQDELKRGDLMRVWVEVIDSPTTSHTELRYALDVNHLKAQANFGSMFAKNSLFFNMTCSGTERGSVSFSYLLQTQAGLGVYAGWNAEVATEDQNETALFFLDRALGLNEAAPVDPSDPPPADWRSILKTMGATPRQSGRTGNLDRSILHYTNGSVRSIAQLKFDDAGSRSLTTLIPSATSAKLTPDGTNVDIKGDFGPDRGTVTVAGNALAIVSWSAKEIVAVKPDATGKAFVTSPTGLIGNSVPIAGSLLTITPNRPSVALGSTTTFTVATELGSFPTGAKFTWTVKGTGTVGGASSTTTTVPHVDYVAPKQATTDTLTVSVKDGKGESLGSGGTNIDVGAAAISLTIAGSWERYGSEGGAGIVPNDGVYSFADGNGLRFKSQGENDPPNAELISLDYANYANGDSTYSPGIILFLCLAKDEAVQEGRAYPYAPTSNGVVLDTCAIALQTPFMSADAALCGVPQDNATGSLTFTNVRQASDGTYTGDYEMDYSNSTGGVLKATGSAKWKYYDASKGERPPVAALPHGRVAR